MSSLPVVSVVETSAGVPSLQSISATQAPLPREPLPTDAQAFEGESILERVLDLEEIDKNIYRGVSPEVPRWGRIYGGQVSPQRGASGVRCEPQVLAHGCIPALRGASSKYTLRHHRFSHTCCVTCLVSVCPDVQPGSGCQLPHGVSRVHRAQPSRLLPPSG